MNPTPHSANSPPGGNIQAASKLFQSVLNSIEAAVWVRDTDDHYIMVNQNFRDLFQIPMDVDVVGKTSDNLLSPSLARQFQANDRYVLEKERMLEIEETVETADGEREFLTRITPIEDDAGEPYALCGVATDITEQKHREWQIKEQNRRLEEFATLVSHDLQTPLSTAKGYLEMALETAVENEEPLNRVNDSLNRIERLVDDMLWLAREGEQIGTMAPVDLAATLNQSWSLVDTPTTDAKFRCDVNPNHQIMADADRLRQLCEKLFENSIGHGGPNVTIRAKQLPSGFAIEDDGPGIPDSHLDHLFQKGVSTKQGGTGIGLSVVNRIVNGHDWTIKVTESDTGGARFEITNTTDVNSEEGTALSGDD